ncbi:uncharacterized protein HD556DRAFT_1313497 [Suillus plorans]|uniref:Uncharacterized protein n=1 Tax=Suillus plorans TaxID=116603 RepID=A0A9P7DAS7_9AGAM|nr:uncharacterized protein HD556DRAFT_1313497 [Suillus plorans]KAG1786492.1 hypothetical protein HD556DRAFT_1313497 [Suillus plorans]
MSAEDMETKYGYEVGPSVAVYAYQKGRRGVDESDLWYGKSNLYGWTSVQKLHSLFGSKSDGSQELLESDLSEWMEAAVLADVTEVVKFDEISGVLKPWDGLYTVGLQALHHPNCRMIQFTCHASQLATNPTVQTRRSNGSAQIATGGIISDVLMHFHHWGLSNLTCHPTEVQAHHKVDQLFKASFAVRLNVVSQLECLVMDGEYIRHANGTTSW